MDSSSLDTDYFANGLEAFADDMRTGTFSIEDATRATLNRISALDPHLKAFECIDDTAAINVAKSLDALLKSGTDLGPLMGVSVAVKDIIAVDGMPTTNGSNASLEHLVCAEGALIKRLRALGCVIVGKTKTVEYALGATGINEARGTPWNPWDPKKHRIPGGSSSGSSVSVASGLCGFALGSDTGGSIRIPASYNGITGHKTSVGLWPTDGVFPLSATFDSVGPLCRTVADAIIIHQCIEQEQAAPITSLTGLRFGLPQQIYFDDLDDEVRTYFDRAVAKLKAAGVEMLEFDIPEAKERETVFPTIVGAEIIASLTPDGFKQAFDGMDPVTRSRAAYGLEVTAVEYVMAQKRVAELQKISDDKFADVDAWISPTTLMQAATVAQIEQDTAIADRALQSSRNTQPSNLFGHCAISIPIPVAETTLPIGLQVMMPGGEDARLLAISDAVQGCLGAAATPDLAPFLDTNGHI